MTGSDGLAARREAPQSAYLVAGFVVLLAVLCGLFYYKWGGAIRTIPAVRSLGRWSGTAEGLTTGGMLRETLFYFRRIWVALVYGLLIGAAVRAYVSPRHVVALLSRGGSVRRQVAGGLAGAPLMLCSCCITPVFKSVYEQGAQLGPALAVMLASPALNPAALILTFILFPAELGLARVVAALLAVLVLPRAIERMFVGTLPAPIRRLDIADDGPQSARELVTRLVRELGYLSLKTIPLVVAGVVLSSLILPAAATLTTGRQLAMLAAVAAVAAIAVLVALPTFFEIPLAMLFFTLGAPGAATAMLFAGPTVNLPSLLILGRETNPKVAIALALGVWALALAAGMMVGAVA